MCMSDFFTNEESLCVAQKLEEGAANAAEEERRRLQTQNELQDHYRLEMEKEKMVVACSLNLVGDCLASILLMWLLARTLLCPLISCTCREVIQTNEVLLYYFSSTGPYLEYYRKYAAA